MTAGFIAASESGESLCSGESSGDFGRSENSIHDCGQMNQHSTIAPAIRRQDVQWSRDMMGRCSVISFWAPSTGCVLPFGISGREESSGIESLYLMALQKQPPVSMKGVEGRDAMTDFRFADWKSWQSWLICWNRKPHRANYIPSYA